MTADRGVATHDISSSAARRALDVFTLFILHPFLTLLRIVIFSNDLPHELWNYELHSPSLTPSSCLELRPRDTRKTFEAPADPTADPTPRHARSGHRSDR
jgi:hypothetical protein